MLTISIDSPCHCAQTDGLIDKPGKRNFMGSHTILALALGVSLGADAYADSRVQSKYTSNGQSNETTIYSKGVRQRFEPGAGMTIINQNDLKRTIQIFEQKKTYMVMSPETLARAAAALPQVSPSAPANSSTGGVVDVVVDITDTGEQKELFGYKARRVKTVTTRAATAGACDPVSDMAETDGWYIDYEPPVAPNTASLSEPQPGAAPACHDDIRYKQTGDGKLGYPLAFTMKTTRDGKITTITMEVTAFSTADLDAALFEIPEGYTEMQSFTDLSALLSSATPASAASPTTAAGGRASSAAPPKASGAIRVGVADLGNKSGKSFGPVSPREHLIAQLVSSSIDAIPLAGLTPSDVEDAARQQEVDYVLYAEVTDVKKDSGGLGRLGGALNKASSLTGGGAAKEKLEAKVEYKLMPLGNSKPLVSSSATGSNGGGFSVTSAVHLATFATQFTPLGMMSKMGMFDPNMMQLLSGSGGAGGLGGLGGGARGGAGGGGLGGVDPLLGSFLSIMKTTQSLIGSAEPTEEGKAASDALSDVAKKVSETLKKKK